MATTASASPVPHRASSARTFLDIINPLGLLNEAKQLTPREFLRDFYTRRGLQDKLKDVDALVAAYGHQMPQLYIELDKKYGTNFATNPPPVINEVHQGEPVMQYVTPVTPKAPLTKAQSHKIVLLGNSGVGKTNLLSRLNKGEFSTEFTSTVGVEFLTHKMQVNDVEVKAQIWDTAGQERFHAMMATYYRKAVGALLIFDVRDRQNLLGIEEWLDQLLNVAEPGLHAVLVGNKCDLAPPERVV
ncbi:Rab11 family gtpase, partial [Globisporangium splendens]